MLTEEGRDLFQTIMEKHIHIITGASELFASVVMQEAMNAAGDIDTDTVAQMIEAIQDFISNA